MRPQLERDDQPQELAVVGLAGDVTRGDSAARLSGSRSRRSAKRAAADDVGGERPCSGLRGTRRRAGWRSPASASCKHLGRKPARGHATQQMLAAPALHAHRGRQTHRELDDARIEKRRAPFQRAGHGHAVELDQDVVGQVAGEVDRDAAIERVETWRGGAPRHRCQAAVMAGAREPPTAGSRSRVGDSGRARVSATPLR